MRRGRSGIRPGVRDDGATPRAFRHVPDARSIRGSFAFRSPDYSGSLSRLSRRHRESGNCFAFSTFTIRRSGLLVTTVRHAQA